MRVLTNQRRLFVQKLIECGNQTQAYKLAYPNCIKDSTAQANASRLLSIDIVAKYRDELLAKMEDAAIAKPAEVLKYYTAVMRGELKDQFGLDVSIQDKTEAAKQLAKRMGLDKNIEDKNKQGGSVIFEFKRAEDKPSQ